MFQPNRENYKIFSVELVDPKDPPMGGINIELIEHDHFYKTMWKILKENTNVLYNIYIYLYTYTSGN
jgi:hypothetical protein